MIDLITTVAADSKGLSLLKSDVSDYEASVVNRILALGGE